MRLSIVRPGAAELDRCLELIERTNQLNLSTRRYSPGELDALVADTGTDCYALRCADRFGDYGLVGFASIERAGDAPTLRDFVLSCRVAEKRVEEAFIYWYARRVMAKGADRLRAVLVATDRNEPLRATLRRLPFVEVSVQDRTAVLELPLREPLPVPDIIRIDHCD
jgi:FkbH-like protein